MLFRSNPTLSTRQEVFKKGADALRKQLAGIPAFKNIMNEYRFNIEAAESLLEAARKAGNQRIFTLFDAVVGGTSILLGVGATATGVTAAIGALTTTATANIWNPVGWIIGGGLLIYGGWYFFDKAFTVEPPAIVSFLAFRPYSSDQLKNLGCQKFEVSQESKRAT